MYEVISPDRTVVFKIFCASCPCRRPRLVERYNWTDGRWLRSPWYRRFDTYEECRAAANKVIESLKIPTKTEPI